MSIEISVDSSLPLIQMKVGKFNDEAESECGWNGHRFEKTRFLFKFSEAGPSRYIKYLQQLWQTLTAVSLCVIDGRCISEGICTSVCVAVHPTPYHPVRNSSLIFVRIRNIFIVVFVSHEKQKQTMEWNWNKTQKTKHENVDVSVWVDIYGCSSHLWRPTNSPRCLCSSYAGRQPNVVSTKHTAAAALRQYCTIMDRQ